MKQKPDDLVLGNNLLWRGVHPDHHALSTVPTGHANLDAILPGGGWPLGAITEIIAPDWGIGELRLLLPVMVLLSRDQRWLAWVSPPYLPYSPALTQGGVDLQFCLLIRPREVKDMLWSMEKLLRNRKTGLVLAWPASMTSADLRRLQLAAESGQCLGILFHQQTPAMSAAALRLGLKYLPTGLEVTIQKARGSWCRDTALIPV